MGPNHLIYGNRGGHRLDNNQPTKQGSGKTATKQEKNWRKKMPKLEENFHVAWSLIAFQLIFHLFLVQDACVKGFQNQIIGHCN